MITVALDPCGIVAKVSEEKAASDTGRLVLGQAIAPLGGTAESVRAVREGVYTVAAWPDRGTGGPWWLPCAIIGAGHRPPCPR